jgi:hypothetical protein
LFLTDDDQALAAELGFHRRDPPQCGGSGVVMFIRRFSDHASKALEQQPENGLALAFGLLRVPVPVILAVAFEGLPLSLPNHPAHAVP